MHKGREIRLKMSDFRNPEEQKNPLGAGGKEARDLESKTLVLIAQFVKYAQLFNLTVIWTQQNADMNEFKRVGDMIRIYTLIFHIRRDVLGSCHDDDDDVWVSLVCMMQKTRE